MRVRLTGTAFELGAKRIPKSYDYDDMEMVHEQTQANRKQREEHWKRECVAHHRKLSGY